VQTGRKAGKEVRRNSRAGLGLSANRQEGMHAGGAGKEVRRKSRAGIGWSADRQEGRQH
jgi:hypothetical protein